MSRRPPLWEEYDVEPGGRFTVRLEVGESYTGLSYNLPMMIWRGLEEGPTVLITAAVHGDEINGTGAIRELIWQPDFELKRGALVLLPVVNVMGFERHSRYMPDRRDLNRHFPGSEHGSITGRLAYLLMEKVIRRCDYVIDLHTASVRRTNYPNVRADMENEGCALLANAFGCEVIVDNTGPDGSLRACATQAGVPAIILEAGEVWKVEPTYIATAKRGIRNCLATLGMIDADLEQPAKSVVVNATRWVRAGAGGFLQFHVGPGDLVTKGQLIATNAGLLGREQELLEAPCAGIVIGISTMPSVSPGDAVLQIAIPGRRGYNRMEKQLDGFEEDSLELQLREDLSTNLHVVNPEQEDAS